MQRVVALALGVLVSTLLERDAGAAADVEALEDTVPLGSKECPLDISVLWTADVDSPVYSTPVIRPSSVDRRKQVRTGRATTSMDYIYSRWCAFHATLLIV